MAKTQFLTYYICLTDPDLVKQYQETQWVPAVTVPGTIPLGVVNRAIYNPGPPVGGAVAEFSAPFHGFEQPSGPGPYIWTPWYGAGIPDDEDGPFPLNVATFQRKTGGFWGIGGTTIRYYWMGQFVYVSSGTVQTGPGVPAPPTNLAQVIWANGFELHGTAESGTAGEGGTGVGVSMQVYTRDASRHVDGFGMAIRGTTEEVTIPWALYGGANPSTGWVRFYWRVRKLPTAPGKIFGCQTSTEGNNALELRMTPSGTLAVYTRQATVVTFLTGLSFQFELNRWYRMDCLMKCGQNPPNDGRFRLYVNGNKEADLNITTNEGLGGGGVTPRLLNVSLGSAVTPNGGEWDFDDASGHAFPVSSDDESFLGADFQNGSRVVQVRPLSFEAAGAWSGDARQLLQNPPQLSDGGPTSTTSGDTFQVTTDAALSVKAVHGALGCTAIVVAAYSERTAGTANSQLGYSAAGAGPVMSNVSVTTTPGWDQVIYAPAFGAALPTDPTPFKFRYIKAADATSTTVKALLGAALLIGQFGPEDAPPWSSLTSPGTDPGSPDTTAPLPAGHHNAPYPQTPWALAGALPPLAPFQIVAGTYTGNNIAQDLFLNMPAAWWHVRPLAADTGGVTWWSTQMAARTAFGNGTRAAAMAQALMDPDFVAGNGEDVQQARAIMRITGTNANANANAATYQYIAVCDPGQRFVLNSVYRPPAAAASYAHPLADSGFTPEWAFFQHERADSSTTARTAFKGPGHGSDAAQIVGSAVGANFASMAAGVLTSLVNANLASMGQVAVSLWRRDDTTGDPNNVKVVRGFSYTGDGAGGNRTLTIPNPTGTCRPLFAIVAQSTIGTATYQRDPSHTTTNSTRWDTGGSSATAIVGGDIDSIIVGTTLNANGVTYNVFVILCESAAGNGGWGTNGTYTPVEPDTAPGDQWSDPFPGEPTTAPADIPADLETDLSATCAPFTLKVVNLALHLIGSSQTIVDLSTDATREGETMRLLYSEAVEQVLRDHPWRFARRYATLAWLAGEADGDMATPDYRFQYRTPLDMVAARRLIRPELGRKFDPDPPPFTLMTDATSDDRRANTILCSDHNSADETDPDPEVELEYTARVLCPAGTGDALFRLALAWQLAHLAAPSLSRDEKRVTYCFQQYLGVLNRAQTADRTEAQEEPPGEASWMTARDQ